jgi:hypothetical protein
MAMRHKHARRISGDRGGKQARRCLQDEAFHKGTWIRKDVPRGSNLVVTYVTKEGKKLTKRQRKANIRQHKLELIADKIIAQLRAE